jgi:hypothetical protein
MSNKVYEELDKFLTSKGWSLDCYSPLEISNEEAESRASGIAAEIVIDYLRKEEDES